MKTTYTKANISSHILINIFGIKLGFIDSSTPTIEELEKAVDKTYSSVEQINSVIRQNSINFSKT